MELFVTGGLSLGYQHPRERERDIYKKQSEKSDSRYAHRSDLIFTTFIRHGRLDATMGMCFFLSLSIFFQFDFFSHFLFVFFIHESKQLEYANSSQGVIYSLVRYSRGCIR